MALMHSLNESALLTLVNTLPNPIYVKDSDHKWIFANDAFCELQGMPRDDLLGKSDFDLNSPEEAQIFWEKDNQVFQTRETNVNIEKTTNVEGISRWVQSKKTAYEDAEGNLFLFGILTDITELKDREADLEQARIEADRANVAKSEFLANMSHEIRTPMNGIMGMAELLSQSAVQPREKNFISVIDRSANALLTIINDILDFSKIEAGQMTIENHSFNLRDCLEDILALLAPKVDGSQIDLLLRIQPDLPLEYIGDAGRIRQVLMNIVGNAIKFTAEGHVFINVSGTQRADSIDLRINVEDTGIGLPPDKQKSIFEKFTQADNSTTREYGGTGLGLSIAKNLVDLMDGEISLRSTEGKGTTFTISLSLPISTQDAGQTKTQHQHTGLNILVIDDNAVNCAILKEQIAAWSSRAIPVSSGKRGLMVLEKAAQKNVPIDMIIVDYQMPQMNGEDFVRQIKAHSEFRKIPVIMLSSVDKCELRDRMLDLKIDSFMTKPARASVLYDEVNSSLRDRPIASKNAKPKANHTAPAAAAPSATQNTPKPGQLDVLIAEDNDINQLYARYILEELDLSFKIVENGRQAVNAWETYKPKIILMDISMPEMNGLDATRAIRSREKAMSLTATPIIAITAHSLSGDAERCIDAGMDQHLAKPLSVKQLENTLQDWGVFRLEANHKVAS